MIRRDANHPSAIFWSVSNENQEDRPEVAEGNRALVQLAKELDPKRLAVHVSDHWQKHPNFAHDDVICVNGYPSLHRHAYDGEYDYDLFESTRFWREGLQALHEQYPGKPILVSEFGYAALEDVHGSAFGEEMQAEAIEIEFAGMDAPYVCGATVWCWADHPWPAATFQFCRYLAISPYGVVTRERRKLKAYWTVRRLFREKQGLEEKPRAASVTPGAAGYGLRMIRPHMDDIPLVPFPEGYSIRPMRLGEGALWTDIERDTEAYFPIGDRLFENEFGRDPQATQWRCFFVVNEKGVAVGTVSAWYNRTLKGQDYGQIHWVAVRPAYQGKGLGKAALSYALNQMAQWHERCFLDTQSKRLPAISLYLDFGFLPDMDEPGATEGWREVKEQLTHPALEAIEGL
jgi:GNAT superfamily N-acetyltransferase